MKRGVLLGILALVALVQGVALLALRRDGDARGPTVIRTLLDLPPDSRVATSLIGNTIAVSPDGQLTAYTAITPNGFQLYVRRADELLPRALGERGAAARNLTFSPDGVWLAYTEGNVVRRIAVAGGAAVALGTTGEAVPHGMVWSASDTLRIGSYAGLLALAATGETPTGLARDDSSRAGLRWPIALPGADALLVVRGNSSSAPAQLSRVDPATGTLTHYELQVSTPVGVVGDQLVYVAPSGSLMRVSIDAGSGEPRGTPVLIDEGLLIDPSAGAKVSLSASGTIAYLKGGAYVQPVLVTPGTGATVPLLEETRGFTAPRYSPDGARVAFGINDPSSSDIWVYDVRRRALARLTSDGKNVRPEWTPDSREIVFVAERAGEYGIWRQIADGSAPARLLFKPPVEPFEALVSPDRRWLLYRTAPGFTASRDIFAAPFEGEHKPILTVVEGPESESQPRLSPDSRWLAYQSNESGRFEVYVRPFPGAGDRVAVSSEGGEEAIWGRDGRTLFYRRPLGEIVRVDVTTGARFTIRGRAVVAAGEFIFDPTHANWDVAPDGRFLLLRPAGDPTKVVLVHRWADELRAAKK